MPRMSSHAQYLQRNNNTTEQRLRYKFSMCKAHAAERGIAYTLTFDEFTQMWRDQAGCCAYTGRRMFLTIGRGVKYRNCSVSIDRLDPAGSYTKDNVVFCRYDANRRKSKRSFFTTEFLELFPDYVANLLTLKPSLNTLAA